MESESKSVILFNTFSTIDFEARYLMWPRANVYFIIIAVVLLLLLPLTLSHCVICVFNVRLQTTYTHRFKPIELIHTYMPMKQRNSLPLYPGFSFCAIEGALQVVFQWKYYSSSFHSFFFLFNSDFFFLFFLFFLVFSQSRLRACSSNNNQKKKDPIKIREML